MVYSREDWELAVGAEAGGRRLLERMMDFNALPGEDRASPIVIVPPIVDIKRPPTVKIKRPPPGPERMMARGPRRGA
jgi:hypothetical protein